ncbi:ParB/RepB/Spo0J family partition protein [Planktotalea sp.]|uniref:ParB/RepB/Spo0J family partition protein n=1 Tax=Planktotalea sp. TaxID=2029877 RepID=UPI003F6C39E0
MSRKRRVFDIAMPEDEAIEIEPKVPAGRRGPMASAISENAEALQIRKSAAEAIREENDALAHEFVALRDAGAVVQSIPLENVKTFLLVRDRLPGEDIELDDLVLSIREVGLSNPIRVVPRSDGTGFELVQGFRRWSAYQRLLAETGDDIWKSIPALVMPGEPDISGLYRRMIDENLIRKDLSFAEMAYAAQNYAADPETDADSLSDAVAALFQSAPYSKRSYIRSFAYLLDQLSSALLYPTEIPRALGVSVARAIKERPELLKQIKDGLSDWESRSIKDELNVLKEAIGEGAESHLEAAPAVGAKTATTSAKTARSKTTFHIGSSFGQIKCTAGLGRLEIKVDRDFSSIDRGRLERAIAALVDGLN